MQTRYRIIYREVTTQEAEVTVPEGKDISDTSNWIDEQTISLIDQELTVLEVIPLYD